MASSLKTDRKRRQSLPVKLGADQRKKCQGEKRRNSEGEGYLSSTFTRAFATYGHLICYNYPEQTETRRRKCAKILFDAFIEEALQTSDHKQQSNQPESVSQVHRLQRFLSSCLNSFGLGDVFLRQQVSIALVKTCKVSILSKPWIHPARKILFQFLTITFPSKSADDSLNSDTFEEPHDEEVLDSIFKTVHGLLHDKHRSKHMTIMKPLNQLPFPNDYRTRIRQIVLNIISEGNTDDDDFANLLSFLFDSCKTRNEVFQSVDFTRIEWRKREREIMLNQNAFLTLIKIVGILWGADDRFVALENAMDVKGSVQERYSTVLDSFKQSQGDEDHFLVLDMLFLFSSKDITESSNVKRIMNSWRKGATNSFDAGLRSLCQLVESISQQNFDFSIEHRDLLQRLHQCISSFILRVVFLYEWRESSIEGNVMDGIGALLCSLPPEQRRLCFRSVATKFTMSITLTSGDSSSQEVKNWKIALYQVGPFLEHVAGNSLVEDDCWPLLTFINILLETDEIQKRALETVCICLSAFPICYEETLNLIQTLLFRGFLQVQIKFAERGLVLATFLLRANQLGGDQLKRIQCLLQKFLLPPQRRMMEPELGPQALACIQSLQSSMSTRSSAFRLFKAILSNTGLIQSLSHFQKQSNRKYPSHLITSSNRATLVENPQEANETVFCVAYFFHYLDSAFKNDDKFHRFEAITDWVYHLVNAYLTSGRAKAKSWNATLWLNSAIEFPKVSSEDKNVFSSVIDKLNLLTTSKAQNLDFPSHSLEALWQTSSLSSVRDVVRSLSTVSLSILTASAIRSAVVNHAHEHLRSLDASQSHATILQIKKQIDCNVLELFNLRKKADIIKGVASSLEACLRKAIKQVALKAHTASSEPNCREEVHASIKSTVNKMTEDLYRAPKFVSTKVLWSCLYDGPQEEMVKSTLHSALSREKMSTSEIVKFRQAIKFKELLLEHLQQPFQSDPECLPRLKDCIESVAFWSDLLFLRKQDHKDNSLQALPMQALSRVAISSVFLVISILEKSGRDATARARDMLADAFAVEETQLIAKMCCLRRSCQDLEFADGILELASILFSDDSDDSLNQLLAESYQMIRHDRYACVLVESGYRRAPFCVQQIHLEEISCRDDYLPTVRKVFHQLMLGNHESREAKERQQRNMLLRHFGLFYLSKERQRLFTDHVGELALELASFLMRKPRNKRPTSSTEPIVATSMPMPEHSLSQTNFHVLWEALLHISVSACIIFKPEGRDSLSPYKSFVDIAGIFQLLLQTYSRSMMSFPRKSVGVAFQSARCMLEASTYSLELSVQWRNEQQMPQGQGDPDYGSVSLLQDFVDALASRVCASIFRLCECWQKNKELSLTATTKSKNLLALADKFSTTLHEVSEAHHLKSPKFDKSEFVLLVCSEKVQEGSDAIKETKPKKKRRVALTTIGKLPNSERTCDTTNRTELQIMDNDHEDKDVDMQDESMEEFEVSGGWGQSDCIHSADDDSTIGGIEITKAV